MNTSSDMPKMHEEVVLIVDRPHDHLRRGQVGSVVYIHGPETVEVEFVDRSGQTYALLPLSVREVLVLRYAPTPIAR